MYHELSNQTRLEIVIQYAQHNISQRTLAKKYKCAPSTIAYILKLYKQTKNVIDRPRSGRPKKLNRHHKKRLSQAIDRQPNSTSDELASNLQRSTGINVTSRTIRRERRNLKYYPVKEKIRFELTEIHKKKRVDFCRLHFGDNKHLWCFSDEKIFTLSKTSNKLWIRRNTQIPHRPVKNMKIQFHVWGCIWYNGRSELAFIDGNLNSKSYIKILEDYLLPSIPSHTQFTFQQDNAPSHSAKSTLKRLDELGINYLKDWPPYSPDLNPIEFVWSEMAREVAKESPQTAADLKNAIRLSWENFKKSDIQSYIDHFQNTMQRVIDTKGEFVQ